MSRNSLASRAFSLSTLTKQTTNHSKFQREPWKIVHTKCKLAVEDCAHKAWDSYKCWMPSLFDSL